MELLNAEDFLSAEIKPSERQNEIIAKIIASYNNSSRIAATYKTFSEVYAEYFSYKYERNRTREYSKSSVYAIRSAYNHSQALHDRPFQELRTEDLQKVIDNCEKNMRPKNTLKIFLSRCTIMHIPMTCATGIMRTM